MRGNRALHRSLGILFWLAAALGPVLAIGLLDGDRSREAGASLWRWLRGADRRVAAYDPTGRLRRSDPVFLQDATGAWRQIGYVLRRQPLAEGSRLELAWYAGGLPPEQAQLTQYHNRGRLQDILATMLPPEKRQQIQRRLSEAMSVHGEELSRALLPLVEQSLRESLPVIETELRASAARHREEIERLAERLDRELIQQRLLPLARREVVPIVLEHGRPPIESIGRELWDRASLWRFGWRALYDRTPLPDQDLLQREWDRFVEQEAIPVFEAHMEEIALAVKRTLADLAANPTIRSELAAAARDIANDPEARRLLRVILRETLVDNERLHAVWRRVWSSERAQRATELAAERLEPVVRGIGDDLFGTREGGIAPNFARVLRSQILGKDRRWIVARRSDSPHPELVIGTSDQRMLYPIVHLASGRDEASP